SAHRSLPPKLQSIEMASLDVTPEQRLGARHRAPKRFRPVALSVADGSVRHARLPPSLSFPRKGGGNPNTKAAALGTYCAGPAHTLSPPASVGRSSGRKP